MWSWAEQGLGFFTQNELLWSVVWHPSRAFIESFWLAGNVMTPPAAQSALCVFLHSPHAMANMMLRELPTPVREHTPLMSGVKEVKGSGAVFTCSAVEQ